MISGMKDRQLKDLVSIGPAALKDFKILGISTISELAKQNPQELYNRLCKITHAKHDICVLDVFTAAVEQAKNPNLEPEKRNWWYWCRIRKAK